MPNIKSAIKRVRVSEKKNLRNRMVKSAVKTSIKKFNTVADSGDAVAAADQLRLTSGAIDKAKSKGIINKNAANRRKAQIAKKLAALNG